MHIRDQENNEYIQGVHIVCLDVYMSNKWIFTLSDVSFHMRGHTSKTTTTTNLFPATNTEDDNRAETEEETYRVGVTKVYDLIPRFGNEMLQAERPGNQTRTTCSRFSCVKKNTC